MANQFELETLEPRILLSTDVSAVAAAASPSNASIAVANVIARTKTASSPIGAANLAASPTQVDSMFEGLEDAPAIPPATPPSAEGGDSVASTPAAEKKDAAARSEAVSSKADSPSPSATASSSAQNRSEERRVGKECRSR